MSLSLSELDSGSWVIFELPGFTTAASGTPQDSLDALRKASDTSYYKDKDALWVKVVSDGDAPRRRPWWWNQHPGQPVSCTLAMSESPRRRPGASQIDGAKQIGRSCFIGLATRPCPAPGSLTSD